MYFRYPCIQRTMTATKVIHLPFFALDLPPPLFFLLFSSLPSPLYFGILLTGNDAIKMEIVLVKSTLPYFTFLRPAPTNLILPHTYHQPWNNTMTFIKIQHWNLLLSFLSAAALQLAIAALLIRVPSSHIDRQTGAKKPSCHIATNSFRYIQHC